MRIIQLRHNIAIDYVRGVAMMVIVTCHFFMFGGVPGWEPLGQWFAGVGNFLFLLYLHCYLVCNMRVREVPAFYH